MTQKPLGVIAGFDGQAMGRAVRFGRGLVSLHGDGLGRWWRAHKLAKQRQKNDDFARDAATPISEFGLGRLLWSNGRAGDVSEDAEDLRAVRLWSRRSRRR